MSFNHQIHRMDTSAEAMLNALDLENTGVLMLGFEGDFSSEAGVRPTPEYQTYLELHLSIAIGELLDTGKQHFIAVLQNGFVSKMAQCCARIRDDASNARQPTLWVVVDADRLDDYAGSDSAAILAADHVLAIRDFNEEQIIDSLVCSCGTVLSVFSRPGENPTLQGAAIAEVDIVNVNPAQLLSEYVAAKQKRSE